MSDMGFMLFLFIFVTFGFYCFGGFAGYRIGYRHGMNDCTDNIPCGEKEAKSE